MSSYLLTCECGQSVPVDLSQAGGEVTCRCGRQLPVPKLSQLRQLPRAEAAAGAKTAPASTGWNPVRGLLFAVGTLCLGGGLLGAGYSQYIRLQLPKVDSASVMRESDETWRTRIDALPLLEAWEMWTEMRDHVPSDQHVPDFIYLEQYLNTYTGYLKISLGAAGIGLLLAAAALRLRF